ncbi:MAG: tRNA (adenine(22)-N(1))-methyltransferase TrmK [Gammaproteobacteria bacterium]|nr:tRNA (adenine(22)-N(1))-methyltransferase TrmK [Gammaproteobacteria bacterium]
MNPSASIGPRLNAILELVTEAQQKEAYPCIWDCCCDHGYLGIKILSYNLCEKLVFVDQLPHIIEQLAAKIAPFGTGKHELITADAGDLVFDSQNRHLVILAGVGGECLIEIISKIESKHPDVQIDYIFCPSSRHKLLREYLSSLSMGLLSEQLVCDKKRCYEIIYVQGKTQTGLLPAVSLNCGLWDMDNVDHQQYLKKINTPRASKKPKRRIK